MCRMILSFGCWNNGRWGPCDWCNSTKQRQPDRWQSARLVPPNLWFGDGDLTHLRPAHQRRGLYSEQDINQKAVMTSGYSGLQFFLATCIVLRNPLIQSNSGGDALSEVKRQEARALGTWPLDSFLSPPAMAPKALTHVECQEFHQWLLCRNPRSWF